MIIVHHLEYSQSFRVLWLLEALGAPYEVRHYERDPATRLAPAEYKRLSPLGTAPVITDGEVVLAESNAIIDYILDGYDDGRMRPPPGAPNRVRYLFWFHAGQGSMMPLLMFDAVFTIVRKKLPILIREFFGLIFTQVEKNLLRPRMDAILALAEKDLGEQPWFGGDAPTAADVSMSYCMVAAEARGYVTGAHPNCRAWLTRLASDPAYQRAREKDGKTSLVPPLA